MKLIKIIFFIKYTDITELDQAKIYMAEIFKVLPEAIPDTVGGTPDGSTLYMMCKSIFDKQYKILFPEQYRTDNDYYICLKHEIIHMLHEAICMQKTKSNKLMGPIWFFEGLAIELSGQFPQIEHDKIISLQRIKEIINKCKSETVSYLDYKRIFTAIKPIVSIRELFDITLEGKDPEIFLLNKLQ